MQPARNHPRTDPIRHALIAAALILALPACSQATHARVSPFGSELQTQPNLADRSPAGDDALQSYFHRYQCVTYSVIDPWADLLHRAGASPGNGVVEFQDMVLHGECIRLLPAFRPDELGIAWLKAKPIGWRFNLNVKALLSWDCANLPNWSLLALWLKARQPYVPTEAIPEPGTVTLVAVALAGAAIVLHTRGKRL